MIDQNIPISISTENSTTGADNSEQRISELSKALTVVKEKFISHKKNIKTQIRFWGAICTLLILACYHFSTILLNETFPKDWTWQIGYVSIIRVTIAGAIFSLVAFCFKIFKSYINLNEQNSHSITVIESMANLVGAAKDETQRNLIYSKLIDIIINFSHTEFEASSQIPKNLSSLCVESLEKIIQKKTP